MELPKPNHQVREMALFQQSFICTYFQNTKTKKKTKKEQKKGENDFE
jgi:hypothetical protein